MDVIKKLQIKFIISIVLILVVIFFSILVGINKFSAYQTESMNRGFLNELIVHDGRMPDRGNFFSLEFSSRFINGQWEKIDSLDKKKLFSEPYENLSIRNYFSVKLSPKGEIISIISDFPLHYTNAEVEKLVNTVFLSNNHDSTYEGLRYMIAKKQYGYIAVFTETRIESNMQSRLFKISFVIFTICLVLSIFIAWLISLWVIKPVRSSFEKQRRFVSDASHELKTPLSVISANLDVLEAEVGENKWSNYIKSELKKMSTLIKDLLYLAKSDQIKNNLQKTEFDLSRSILSLVLPFEAKVFESGKFFEIDVQENVKLNGIQSQIEQIVMIFLDNALKYSNHNGLIKLKLKTSGNKKIITVYNTGEGIPLDKQKLIFERFYRLDDSRNRETGGFGLGLAIAKKLIENHNGKITLNSHEGEFTEFSVIL